MTGSGAHTCPLQPVTWQSRSLLQLGSGAQSSPAHGRGHAFSHSAALAKSWNGPLLQPLICVHTPPITPQPRIASHGPKL
jgi:hypothetical protein